MKTVTIADLTCEQLDQLVHDEALAQASNANNGGVKEQLNYLSQNEWTDADIISGVSEEVDNG